MDNIDEYLAELDRHNDIWNNKVLLRTIYKEFFYLIKEHLYVSDVGDIVEIGSGIGQIREVIPDCICTGPYKSAYNDNVENAYKLSFEDNSVSNLILFDVFHHIRYPGDVFNEFQRVLIDSGRVIIFEPCISLLGLLVYGLFHEEPIGVIKKIEWNNVSDSVPGDEYYAAQGNASRIFVREKCKRIENEWNTLKIIKLPAISYITSGGYKGRQLYPARLLPLMKLLDKVCGLLPALFATRMLVLLEKKN